MVGYNLKLFLKKVNLKSLSIKKVGLVVLLWRCGGCLPLEPHTARRGFVVIKPLVRLQLSHLFVLLLQHIPNLFNGPQYLNVQHPDGVVGLVR